MTMRPYLAQGRLTEDPLDGTHPPKSTDNVNRSHKKGARQEGKQECQDDEDDPFGLDRETITAVAIREPTGIVHTLPSPARHNDVISAMHRNGLDQARTFEQGFLTSTGRFVTRWQAARVAAKAGQCEYSVLRRADGELFSEDVW